MFHFTHHSSIGWTQSANQRSGKVSPCGIFRWSILFTDIFTIPIVSTAFFLQVGALIFDLGSLGLANHGARGARMAPGWWGLVAAVDLPWTWVLTGPASSAPQDGGDRHSHRNIPLFGPSKYKKTLQVANKKVLYHVLIPVSQYFWYLYHFVWYMWRIQPVMTITRGFSSLPGIASSPGLLP